MHAWCVIVTNHVGEDLYGFRTPCRAGTAEFFVRQILGSVSFPGNSDWSDFFNAGLNYQIDHLFPDLSMLTYRKMQPHVKRVCAEHGVPYVQESVLKHGFRRRRFLAQISIKMCTKNDFSGKHGIEAHAQALPHHGG